MTDGAWPIIIGGCFRSGTSLVRRLLNAHPGIHCGSEIKFFRDFYRDYREDPFDHLRFTTTARAVLPETELLTILGAAFVALHRRAAELAGKARWADKAPENVLYLEDWQRLLGNRWHLIQVVRNPLDTLASIKEARFPLSIPAGLESRIEMYRRYTRAGLDFSKDHRERSYTLVYERLVGKPRRALQELMTWLGEPFHVSQLDYHRFEHDQGLEDPKIAGTAGIHRSSLHRWHSVLSDGEAAIVWSRTADLWKEIDPELRYCGTSLPRAEAAATTQPFDGHRA